MINPFQRRYSKFGEEQLIQEYLKRIAFDNDFIVDIGASDGIKMSNTFRLFKQGYPGLAIESDPDKFLKLTEHYDRFDNVIKACQKATPENINSLLREHAIPQDFLLLSLDIDGYDYFVLEALLNEFRPQIVVTEINESIPPPVKFKVKFDSDFHWKGGYFFGYSLACLQDITDKFDYQLADLEYNNAFLIAKEALKVPTRPMDEIYDKGYKNRPDRQRRFPYNREISALMDLTPEDVVIYLKTRFREHQGKYILHP